MKHKGFTLLEALLAGVILGLAVVTISGLSTRCLAQTQVNREYAAAWHVLDRQLTAIDYAGINRFVQEGIKEGQIKGFGPTFYWKVQATPQKQGSLYLVEIKVSWTGLNGRHEVSAETMLNKQSVAAARAGIAPG
jgi:Tfp pilus assembly protein PilV